MVLFVICLLSGAFFTGAGTQKMIINRKIRREYIQSELQWKQELAEGADGGAARDRRNQLLIENMEYISMERQIYFEIAQARGTARISNGSSSEFHCRVTVVRDATGEVLYESGLIEPGYYIEEIYLKGSLKKGIILARQYGAFTRSMRNMPGKLPGRLWLLLQIKEEVMSRRKSIKLWLVCSLLCLLAGFPAQAATTGGATPQRNGQTEVQIGVVVNYMGKLRFVVLEQGTQVPIPGASVEIYIPALDRYVLFGLTDADGIYELDVAYNMNTGTPDSAQFTEDNGSYTFTGSPLYLSSNNIQYRIYKADWLPHPSVGETILETRSIPQVITIYLHKRETGGGDSGDSTPNPTTPAVMPPEGIPAVKSFINSINEILQSILDSAGPQGNMNSGAIPKTGVEGTVHYWLLGLVFFLLAGGIVCIMLKKDKESTEGERNE